MPGGAERDALAGAVGEQKLRLKGEASGGGGGVRAGRVDDGAEEERELALRGKKLGFADGAFRRVEPEDAVIERQDDGSIGSGAEDNAFGRLLEVDTVGEFDGGVRVRLLHCGRGTPGIGEGMPEPVHVG